MSKHRTTPPATPSATPSNPLADWLRDHTTTLNTLDVDAPLDDLEPLRDIVGDARVVAVGEGVHFVREFTQTRQRIVRFLAERCGFTTLAFEFGLAEAFPVDRWVRGEGGEAEFARLSGTPNAGVNAELLRWLRRHNTTSAAPLRFVGLDVPNSGGELRPALQPLADYLREVDPELVGEVEKALAIAEPIAGSSFAVAAPGWAALDPARQDALTATLARLRLRVTALEPLYVERGGQQRYDLALRHLDAATHTDRMWPAMNDLFTGTGLPHDTSVRDRYLADSLLWYLDRLGPDARIVVGAHNLHIQKTPVSFDGTHAALPMGLHLARALGTDYRAIAQTHTADHAPDIYPGEGDDATGFALVQAELEPPRPGSFEATLTEAGHRTGLSLSNLRRAPQLPDGALELNGMRAQSMVTDGPVREAWDGVVTVDRLTTHHTRSVQD